MKNLVQKLKSVAQRLPHLARKLQLDSLLLPFVGLGIVLLLWAAVAGHSVKKVVKDDWGDAVTVTKREGISADLPNPAETWQASKNYILKPFAKRGELDQGILAFTWLSLKLVAQGYVIALLLGVPLGFFLGLSKTFAKIFDPLIQILRPVSPLAWLPLGMVLFLSAKVSVPGTGLTYTASDLAAIFTIAICSMWPTVLNTAMGVRAIPQDYLNVAKVLKLSRFKTFTKVLLPASLAYMFTGFRLSLGIAWLVIVAAEMLTGKPGVGGFLWQQYNALSYSHIILCIFTIGLVGFVLDRMMSLVEQRFKTA